MKKSILLVFFLFFTACNQDESRPVFADEIKSATILDEAKTKGKYIINDFLLTKLASIFNEQEEKEKGKEKYLQSINEDLVRRLKQLEGLFNNLQPLNEQASFFQTLLLNNIVAETNLDDIDGKLMNTLSAASMLFNKNVATMYIIESHVRQTKISINTIEAEYLNLTIRFLETLKTTCVKGIGMPQTNIEILNFQVEYPKSQLEVNDNDKELHKNEDSNSPNLDIDNSNNSTDYKSQFNKQNPDNKIAGVMNDTAYDLTHRATHEDIRPYIQEHCKIVQDILTPLPSILKGNINQKFIQEQTVNFEKLNQWIKDRVGLEKALSKKERMLHKKYSNIRLNSLNEEERNKLTSFIKEKELSDEKQEELQNIWLEAKDKENNELAKSFSQFIKDFTKTNFDGNRLTAFKELVILSDINKKVYLKELISSEEFKKLAELDNAMMPTELSVYIYTLVAINHLKASSIADNVRVRKNLDKFESYFSKEKKDELSRKAKFMAYLANSTARSIILNKNDSTFAQEITESQVIGELYLELDQIIFKIAQSVTSTNNSESNGSMYRELAEQQDKWYKKLIQTQEQFPKNNLLSNLQKQFQDILEEKKNALN